VDNVWKQPFSLGMTRHGYPQEKELLEGAIYMKSIHSHSFTRPSTSHTVVVPNPSRATNQVLHFSPSVMSMKLRIK
jgi:hypothetical protein